MAAAKCPRCGELLRIPEGVASFDCPSCGVVIAVKGQIKARPIEPAKPNPFDFAAGSPPQSAPPLVDAKAEGVREGVYCFGCGAWIHRDAETCPKCGVRQFQPARAPEPPPAPGEAAPILLAMLTLVCAGILAIAQVRMVRSDMRTDEHLLPACVSVTFGALLLLVSIMSISVGFSRGRGSGIAAGVIGILGLLLAVGFGVAVLLALLSAPPPRRF